MLIYNKQGWEIMLLLITKKNNFDIYFFSNELLFKISNISKISKTSNFYKVTFPILVIIQ